MAPEKATLQTSNSEYSMISCLIHSQEKQGRQL